MTGPSPPALRQAAGPSIAWTGFCVVVLTGAAVVGLSAGHDAPELLGGEVVVALALGAVAVLLLARDASWGIGLCLLASLFAIVAPGAGKLHWERLALGALVVAWLFERRRGRRRLAAPGAIEALMVAFLLIEVCSLIAPHTLPATTSDLGRNPGSPISLLDAVEAGAFIPFALFFLARQTFDTPARLERFLWLLVGIGVYAGATNILEEVGPHALVWPASLLDQSIGADELDRARGVLLNAAPTGTALVLALVAALHLAAAPAVRGRRVAVPAAAVMLLGIYYTHERGPLLATVVVLLGAAVVGPRSARRWLVLVLAGLAVVAFVNRDALLGSERASGGLASQVQIDDRLNIAATGVWAVGRKPLLGWGLGRYALVNTYHHRSCCGAPWQRGYANIAHDTSMGIAVELGLVGLAAWWAILVGLVAIGRRAWRGLPRSGVGSRDLAVAFLLAAVAWFINASLIDMRLFTFPTAALFVWAGGLAALTAGEQPRPFAE